VTQCEWPACTESSGVYYTNDYCSRHDKFWFKLFNITYVFWLPLAVAALWFIRPKEGVRS